jgi:hypothetical protein
MSQALPQDWRQRIEEILCEHVGALGSMILQDVLDSTGFSDKEPTRREALHVFEVLKRELPSQLLNSNVPEQLLSILFGHQGGTP